MLQRIENIFDGLLDKSYLSIREATGFNRGARFFLV